MLDVELRGRAGLGVAMNRASRIGVRMRGRFLAGAVATLALAGLALPAAGEAYVYWMNQMTGSIGRATLDGTGVNQSFIPTGAGVRDGVAVDGSYVYWANVDADTIYRAKLDGTGPNQSLIAGANDPVGVAVDGSHVYWTNLGDGTIGRADLEGTNVKQDFITGAFRPHGVAVDGSHVYWTNQFGRTIGRATLDGTTEVKQDFIGGASQPTGVAVDGSHVYWTNAGDGTIGRADIDGTNVKQDFITDASNPYGVAVDGSHIYWANYSAGTIGRADLGGTNVKQDFIGGASNPFGVAVDALSPPPDTTAPNVSCGRADGRWHADNVSIACTASDAGSGLADPSQASFSLSTSVPAGSEDADAATNSVKVCDIAGNCTTAGPIGGNKIDRKAPQVTLTSPRDGASYSALATLLDPVRAQYSCSDTGSGVASCSGTRPDGAVIDTGPLALGDHTFTVTATDQVGHKTTVTHRYQVTL